jgi:hypothetical protein
MQLPSVRVPLVWQWVLAALTPVLVLGWGLRRVLPTLGHGLWGPEDPFRNGDVAGGWWLWWASSRAWRGEPVWDHVGWPDGAVHLAGVIPNPGQMMLLGLTGPPTAGLWNGVQLGHVVLTLLATVFLARQAGARPLFAGGAAALVAASPVMLHEIAGGRPDNLIVWPGLLALAFLLRGGTKWAVLAGLLAAVQGMAYAWHGLVLVALALPLLQSWKTTWRDTAVAAATGAVAIAPYVVWVLQGVGRLPDDAPAVGWTSMPLSAFTVANLTPERFEVHALLLPCSVLAIRGGWRWLLAGAIGVVIALGPEICWHIGEPVATGPWAWVVWAVPPLTRLHHPIRALSLALPVLAVGIALGLERMKWGQVLAPLLAVAALGSASALDRVAAYDVDVAVPFAEPVPGDGPVVDLLGMPHRTALSLQTVHGRPIVEPLAFRREGAWAADLDRVARGQPPVGDLWGELDRAGVEQVWVFDRFESGDGARQVVEAALGPPIQPGVYPLYSMRR